MSTTEGSIDLADYADDPMTCELRALLQLVASWSGEQTQQACAVLEDIAAECAVRASDESWRAGLFLTGVGRLLGAMSVDWNPRAAGEAG